MLDTFLERPALFGDYIGLTPSVWWDDGRIVEEAAKSYPYTARLTAAFISPWVTKALGIALASSSHNWLKRLNHMRLRVLNGPSLIAQAVKSIEQWR